jgi:integrase
MDILFSAQIYPKDRDMSKRWFVRIRTKVPFTAKRPRTLWIPNAETPQERLAIAKKLMADFKLEPKPEPKKNIVLKGMFDLLTEMTPRIRHKTFLCYRNTLTTFESYCKVMNICNYSNKVAIDFLNYNLNQGKSGKTVNNYRIVLKTFFTKLGEKDKKIINIFAKTSKIKGHSKCPVHYKTQQIAQLKEYMRENCEYLWSAVRFVFYCYIRPGELRQLKVCHFDFDDWTIKVPREVSKNGKEQFVAIPEAFRSELAPLCLYQYPQDFYIVGRDGRPSAQQVAQNYWSNEHRKMLRALNYAPDYNFYTWKHTGVVQAVKAGIGLKEIQTQLRHHSLDMTDIYLASFGLADMDNMRAKMPKI